MASNFEQIRMCAFDPENYAHLKTPRATTRPSSRSKSKKSSDAGEESSGNKEASPSNFHIEVRILGGLSPSQEEVFEVAARRWEEIIIGDLQSVQLPTGEIVDDVLIDAQGVHIDGEFGILGRAGPEFLRDNSLPAKGIMEFDIADLRRLEQDDSLLSVIIHEMGHVLGIGTIWNDLSLIVGCPTANPIFIGQEAMKEFGQLMGSAPNPVPVANTGGPGTRCGHWRESVFGHELMTGFLNTGFNPISRMTIASLADLGYEVNRNAADPYSIPGALELALMGIGSDRHDQTCTMCGGGVRPITPVKLPATSYLD